MPSAVQRTAYFFPLGFLGFLGFLTFLRWGLLPFAIGVSFGQIGIAGHLR